MAKKDLNEDILSGGSISDSAKSEKSAKKAEKLAEKAKRMPRKKLRLIRKFRNSEVSLLPKPMKKPKRHSRKSLIGQRLSRMRSAAKKRNCGSKCGNYPQSCCVCNRCCSCCCICRHRCGSQGLYSLHLAVDNRYHRSHNH